MPWAQEVGRSNRPAPTKVFVFSFIRAIKKGDYKHRAPALGAVDRSDKALITQELGIARRRKMVVSGTGHLRF
jgi:hypothetical protein